MPDMTELIAVQKLIQAAIRNSQAPPECELYHRESLVSFLCEHDVIKIGPEQKGNVLYTVQPTMNSMPGVYDI